MMKNFFLCAFQLIVARAIMTPIPLGNYPATKFGQYNGITLSPDGKTAFITVNTNGGFAISLIILKVGNP